MMNQRVINFVRHMIDTYDICSCFDNIDEENTLEDEGLWFECPNCGEPILIDDDWDFDDIIDVCPICEERYDDC